MKKILFSLLIFSGLTVVGVASADYCTPVATQGIVQGDYIARVLLSGDNGTVLDSVTSGDAVGPNYYIYYSGAASSGWLTNATQYSITLQAGIYPDSNRLAAWIDFNGNETFEANEKIGESNALNAGQSQTFSFTTPYIVAGGVVRLRVREVYGTTNIDPCTSYGTYGESEDYNLNLTYDLTRVGGGKKYIPPVDNCPEGDLSPTQYDGLCAGMSASNGVLASAVSTGTTTTGSISTTGSIEVDTNNDQQDTSGTEEETPEAITPIGWRDMDMCPEEEIEDAYLFAHENGITTMDTCVKARTNDFITRGEVAKMVVNYAINVLHMTLPDTDKPCKFTDMASKNMETRSYAIGACQLGIMGLKGDGTPAETFNPDGLLDKAQFATMLSRMIYGSENNDTVCWYCKHVEALKADGTIKVTTDLTVPLRRGYAMLMLLRISN